MKAIISDKKQHVHKNTIAIINGPNMNFLGKREKNYYGNFTLSEINDILKTKGEISNYEIVTFQSNSESKIVDFIQNYHDEIYAIIINPASLTIHGYSILETMNLFKIPFIEVHMSNIFDREEWHSKSIFTAYAMGIISGFKENVYMLALDVLLTTTPTC